VIEISLFYWTQLNRYPSSEDGCVSVIEISSFYRTQLSRYCSPDGGGKSVIDIGRSIGPTFIDIAHLRSEACPLDPLLEIISFYRTQLNYYSSPEDWDTFVVFVLLGHKTVDEVHKTGNVHYYARLFYRLQEIFHV
jgi:hypothetical protein